MPEPNFPEGQIGLPITWRVPDNIQTQHVTNMVVQHTEHEFIISFFEIKPPLLIGTDEENKAELERMTSVEAKCVARIAVSPGRMKDFLEVLAGNYNNYVARFVELEEE